MEAPRNKKEAGGKRKEAKGSGLLWLSPGLPPRADCLPVAAARPAGGRQIFGRVDIHGHARVMRFDFDEFA